jgi:hypothetical protein
MALAAFAVVILVVSTVGLEVAVEDDDVSRFLGGGEVVHPDFLGCGWGSFLEYTVLDASRRGSVTYPQN